MPTYYRGKDAKLYLGGTLLALAQSASVEINPNPERLFEVGSPIAVGIEMGNVEISGSISRIWYDQNTLKLLGLEGSTASPPVLSKFDLVFKSSPTGAPVVSLHDCVVSTGSIDIPQDGWLMGDIDFLAREYKLIES
jgi:hypothetical protein